MESHNAMKINFYVGEGGRERFEPQTHEHNIRGKLVSSDDGFMLECKHRVIISGELQFRISVCMLMQ